MRAARTPARAFIATAFRTAVAPRGGALARLDASELAAPVMRRCLDEAGLPDEALDEVVLSNALGGGGNPARLALLRAELPERIPGLTIDRQCCGGLDAVILAARLIESGAAQAVLAGGAESWSRRPIRLRVDPDGGPPTPYEQPPFAPWPERDPPMHEAAEALARRLGLTRAEQDAWTRRSHHAALAERARLRDEIVSIPEAPLEADPYARRLTPRLLARARPLNGPDGTVTAANAAPAADGAAFVLVTAERLLTRLRVARPVRVLAGASRGGPPELPGLAPVAAIEAVLAEIGARPADLAAAEIMEAYAAQAIACQRGARIDPSIVNRGGGALARGHPIGASGAVLAVRLTHELRRSGGGTGVAAIAAAGGVGTALALEA
ncbi:thiolase family protein [Oceanicella actignis]|uniref:Acetyl-CoA C-acetyltransferase n=1 Tax=Oceanicella actignis TaxID=1189325 RepID=A0A1M7SUB7_9RHOB|nr:thiolase family protein [Oceanicella actignis]SES71117.1 acetyl-CoA C-acetyltransferase [Oceanicella actignis]SHN62051.1 acetyl-CoA C-acetyltransferase [Oceanicella actignis]